MKLDLTTILNKREVRIDFDFLLNPNNLEDAAELPFDVELKEDIKVTGFITDNDRYLHLVADVSCNYSTNCDRCLKQLEDNVSFKFERYITPGASDLEELGIDEEDIIPVSEGGVNVDRELIEAVSLEIPIYHLCNEDCPGLCSVCGKRLDGACKCENKKEIDPRLESFQKCTFVNDVRPKK